MTEHDYRQTRWGHNVNFLHWIKPGKTMRLAIWGPMMHEKDTLIMSKAGGGELHTRILKVDPCHDPKDMAFVEVRILKGPEQ